MKPGKKKKGIERKHSEEHSEEHSEQDPPTGEYAWMNQQNSRGINNPSGIPSGLEDMSELDAIAWVRKNCKFAQGSH